MEGSRRFPCVGEALSICVPPGAADCTELVVTPGATAAKLIRTLESSEDVRSLLNPILKHNLTGLGGRVILV